MNILKLTFLLGLALLPLSAWGSGAEEKEVVLFDFESKQQHFEAAERIECVPEHATQGKRAGKVTLDQPFTPNIFYFAGANHAGRWGEFDRLIYDIFVEGGAVKVSGFIRDKDGKDWWTRYNYEFTLQPGKRSLAFSLGLLNRQNGKGALDLKNLEMVALHFASDDPKAVATIYLDNARLVKGTGSFETKLLFSFEGADAGKVELEDYPEEFKGKSSMAPVAERATEGKQALKLESHAPAGNVQFSGFEADWSGYDTLALDVFNPSARPVGVSGWIKAKDVNAGWWDRHNWERMLKPGLNTLRLSVGGMTGPDGRKPIDVKEIKKFNLAADRATIFIDNVRLVKGVEEIPVAGLRRFDFGPASAAVMPGFAKVTRDDAYDAAKGFGWLPRGEFMRDFDINEILGRHRPADDLCRDFCQPTRATFAVDLPDGSYGVWLMLGPPGNGWGQTFKRRAVHANGKTVFEQAFDAESFKAYEHRFQDEEDLPGDDLFEKYIARLFVPLRFEVEVAGGQLKLEFESQAWGVMLNGLALWPKASANDAERWLAGFEGFRKDQYQAQHVEKLPASEPPFAATEADKARGYVPFVHAADRRIEVNSQPAPEEAARSALDLAGAPGEPVSACFGLLPLKDLGALERASCSVKHAGTGKTLQARVRVLRYKALNQTAVYVISPKYLDDAAVRPVELRSGVTRSFWVTFELPADAEPGAYAGELILAGATFPELKVPVKLEVWPLQLPEPEFPMGMFMMGPAQAYLALDESREAYWNAWKEILEDARAHGLTSVDPLVGIPLKAIVNGKAEVDFANMDRWMELARAAGFTQELNGYGVGSGLSLRVNADYEAEAKRFGASSYAEAVKAYFDAVREHAKQKNWLPIAFCTDDEYIVHPGGEPAKLAAHHRLLQDNAPGFRFVAFDSSYLDDPKNARPGMEQALADIDTWGAGIHSPREAGVIAKAGRRLWLYNTGMNRFCFGTYMYFARTKHNVQGFFQWVYNGGGTYGNFYLASHVEAHYGVTYPSTRGLRSTPIWERVRAGCWDHRYLDAAGKLIQAAKAAGKGQAEARALQASLDGVLGRLKFGKPDANAVDGEGKADNPMTPENMEAFKREVAAGMLKLLAALK
ncbi:MAG: hypothetical protein M5U26_20120 [Planctomycetota bacterium]|nr:hypothetical protein [Planctomycetota bacterium]